MDWYRREVGRNLLLMNATIRNKSARAVKDVVIKCWFHGPSGTVIGSARKVIYQAVAPSDAFVASDLALGYVDPQVDHVSCGITDAVIVAN